MTGSTLRIVVGGLVGQYPVGGVAYDYLQYVIGLADLGHDVYYHEDTWSWPYDPVRRTISDTGDYSARFINDFFAQHAPALSSRWHYVHDHRTHFGMSQAAFQHVASTADLFINVSGACMLPDDLSGGATTVFIDTDPGYNQIVYLERPSWSDNVERWAGLVDQHDHHLTYAERVGHADCRLPVTGHAWKPTRAPIVRRLWDDIPAEGPDTSGWTTVMTWNAFAGPLRHRGREYGSKGTEFERIIDLPRTSPASFRIALGGVQPPAARLRAHGWEVLDAPAETLTPDRYRRFIGGSLGEVSTAKEVYVALRTGWFSCRTACYLAAGRPAVVQDTGFSAHWPTGEGVLVFDDVDGAAAAVEAVQRDPSRHREAALAVTRSLLDASVVLTRLLNDVA